MGVFKLACLLISTEIRTYRKKADCSMDSFKAFESQIADPKEAFPLLEGA